MQHRFYEPELRISLPNSNETLGVRFSVFGTCTEINSNNNPTITVTVKDGSNTVATATAVNNQLRSTYEAFFEFPGGTDIVGTVSVVVTCTGMNGNATNAGLTIRSQSTLTIANPTQGAEFPSWAAGVVADGEVTGCAGKTMWLRLTDAGYDIIAHQSWVIGTDSQWASNISAVVTAARVQAASSNFSTHASVWDGAQLLVRVSSGFFSVQG